MANFIGMLAGHVKDSVIVKQKQRRMGRQAAKSPVKYDDEFGCDEIQGMYDSKGRQIAHYDGVINIAG